jgi:DNA-binding NarL/FixJ family response regulator
VAEHSIWDEWRETNDKIEKLFAEIRGLQKRERELAGQLHGIFAVRQNGAQLTRRESEVLDALCGPPMLTNKEIAAKLNISERGIKFHVTALLAKYGVRYRQDLVIRCLKLREGDKT